MRYNKFLVEGFVNGFFPWFDECMELLELNEKTDPGKNSHLPLRVQMVKDDWWRDQFYGGCTPGQATKNFLEHKIS